MNTKLNTRLSIKIAGESGSLTTAGSIIVNTLRRIGYWIYTEREFPSLIKGGRANYQINLSDKPVRALSHKIKVGVGLDREGVLDCLDTLEDGGILIHGFERWAKIIKDLPERAEAKNLRVYQIPARELAASNGGSSIMINVVLIGFLWKTLGLSLESLLDSVTKELGKKPELLAINIKCATSGFEFDPEIALEKVTLPVAIDQNVEKMFIDGNRALAMGAIAGGLRAYYGYPMSPSTTILDYIAKTYHKTGILVKQAEDEISAVQMAIGSMYMGTRAMTSTSGGGFALMTETVSMSACNEIPLVVAISQRPGPATGLPTWTGQADLDLCLGAGHGEFTRCIIACSDPVSSFDNSQLAFNIAEKYQIPVMLLTEANISMSSLTVLPFEQGKIAIDRGLSTDIESRDERYEDTPSGISKRWIPGSSQHTFFCNTDEHWADGSTTEDAAQTIKMIDKRLRKTQTLLAELPEPVLYGNSKAAVAYIGWGSTLGTMLDSIDQGADLCYLHYNVVFPLKTDKLNELFATHPNIHIIEGNATGQLANLIHKYTDHKAPKFLKYDGRPFYLEEVLEHCRKNTK